MASYAEQFITVSGDRIFLDIASSGCGNGCLYCYVNSRNDSQILIDNEMIDQICEFLIDLNQNRDYKVISFCPNTEPLKNSRSIEIVCEIINRLARFNYIFQISTKEILDHHTLIILNRLCQFKKQIFLNISIPVVTSSSRLEPFCQSAKARFLNIDLIAQYPNLSSCIYIKPFLNETIEDKEYYIDAIKNHHPNYLVVGFEFKNHNIKMPCTILHHSETASSIFNFDLNSMHCFVSELKEVFLGKINYSSICNIYQGFNLKCEISLNQFYKPCCFECEVLQNAN